MDLEVWRRSVEVEGDVPVDVLVVLPPLDDLADALDPLLHVLAADRVQEGGQLVQQLEILVGYLSNKWL